MRIFGLIHRFSRTFPAIKNTANSLCPNAFFCSNFKGSIFYFNYKTNFPTFYQHSQHFIKNHVLHPPSNCKMIFTFYNFTKFYSFSGFRNTLMFNQIKNLSTRTIRKLFKIWKQRRAKKRSNRISVTKKRPPHSSYCDNQNTIFEWKVFLQDIVFYISIFNRGVWRFYSRNFYELSPFEVPDFARDSYVGLLLFRR